MKVKRQKKQSIEDVLRNYCFEIQRKTSDVQFNFN